MTKFLLFIYFFFMLHFIISSMFLFNLYFSDLKCNWGSLKGWNIVLQIKISLNYWCKNSLKFQVFSDFLMNFVSNSNFFNLISQILGFSRFIWHKLSNSRFLQDSKFLQPWFMELVRWNIKRGITNKMNTKFNSNMAVAYAHWKKR